MKLLLYLGAANRGFKAKRVVSNGASSVATYAPIVLQRYVLCVSQQVSQTAQQGGASLTSWSLRQLVGKGGGPKRLHLT